MTEEEMNSLQMLVVDPLGPIKNQPALTTLLFIVCNNDKDKFEEAIRLLNLFMQSAYDAGYHQG